MSAISSRRRDRRLTDLLLAVLVVAMLVMMELSKGQEVAPYHVLLLGLMLVYGFRVWPPVPTLLVALAVTLATGAIMLRHHHYGYIHAGELVEVPLNSLLFLVMAWHAHRRVAAQREVERMAEQRRTEFERQREFLRDASHAIRTPVAIARGNLELLGRVVSDPVSREDLEIAQRQLDRMTALSNRLLALAKLDSGHSVRPVTVDLAELVDEVGRNWAAGADREWERACAVTGTIQADPEWLQLALDAIIENAVHFTEPGDRIRLTCHETAYELVVTIADSGPGIADEDLPHVFGRFWHRRPPDGPMGSGLGLAMAQAAVQAHGGRVTAGRSADGGALFELRLPRQPQLTPSAPGAPVGSALA
ncbi:sensor histidine kinase [Jiangella mangrovi]|uniref:histidine kinase n=1 Tax=Jiangella mangrovi TaxID=1524084 RepID=A0A7W9GRY6_9ACTN|nr:HAMP domain-containing sensor histidine kinase [Jiangella mangrovi]MBB5788943.1 signal transduction histidine kinase [Jiangella mangrovi]